MIVTNIMFVDTKNPVQPWFDKLVKFFWWQRLEKQRPKFEDEDKIGILNSMLTVVQIQEIKGGPSKQMDKIELRT